MQQHGGSEATAAITSGERHFDVRLLIDWDRDGSYDHELSDLSRFVTRATTDRSLKGGAPADLTLVEGSGAAELSVVLSGDYAGLPLSGIFSPYQPGSPFWLEDTLGAEVTYEVGIQTSIGMVWYPQFIGYVRTTTPDRGSGEVELTALDRVELLRRPVMFPAWAIYETFTSRGIYQSQLGSSQWVIDHCLRECGISPTPFRPTSREENGLPDYDVTGPQIWINGTGHWLPTIGWLDNWNVQEFPDLYFEMYDRFGSPHPDNGDVSTPPLSLRALADEGNELNKYWCTNRDSMTPQGVQVLGFTLITRGDNDDWYQTCPEFEVLSVRIGSKYLINVFIEAGEVWTEHLNETSAITKVSSRVTIPTTGDYQRIDVVWDAFHPNGPMVYVRAGVNTNNGGAYEDLGATYTYVSATDEIKGLFEVRHQVAMNDIYYSSTNFGGLSVASALNWGKRDADYCAVLDRGFNGMSYMPVRKADDSWNIIADVAASEFGAVFWDEQGIFRFWNYDRIEALKSIIARELTLDDITGLRITNTLDSVRNIWSVNAGKRLAIQGVTFEADSVDQFYNTGSTETRYRIWRDSCLSPNPGKLTRYSTIPASAFPQWDDTVEQGYVVQWWNGTDWAEDDGKTSGVDIYCYFDNLSNLVVKIFNGYAEEMRLATNAGQPAMRVEGTAIIDLDNQADIYKNSSSIARFMGRNFRVEGDWIQDYYDAFGFVEDLLEQTSEPTPATDAITMAGDPRLQLGDTLRIRDRFGFGDRFDIQITGITRTFDIVSGLSDTYTVEMVRAPGGIWDDFQYGIWGDTFVWGV